jgi:hypothetical protein
LPCSSVTSWIDEGVGDAEDIDDAKYVDAVTALLSECVSDFPTHEKRSHTHTDTKKTDEFGLLILLAIFN